MTYEALGRTDFECGDKIRLWCDQEPSAPIPIVHSAGIRFHVCQGTGAAVVSDGLISLNGVQTYTVRILDGPHRGRIGYIVPYAAELVSRADQVAAQPAAGALPPGWRIVQPD